MPHFVNYRYICIYYLRFDYLFKRRVEGKRVTTNTHDTHTSNRPIVRTRNLSSQRLSRWLRSHPRFGQRSNMGNSFTKRFLIAVLSILISGLKFITNMLTLGISFLTKKDIPMVDDWATHRDDDERQESIKRSIYVVENNENLFNE